MNSSGILHSVPDYLLWTANLVRGTGAILGIDLIPVDTVSLEAIDAIGQKCAQLNALNLSVMVRFAPGMNGMESYLF